MLAGLADRIYLVTGAGSGIGEATAKRLVAEGAGVVIADVNEAGGRRVAAEIIAGGGRAAFFRADVSKPEDGEALVGAALEGFGRLDGAVNNAAVGQPAGRMHETTDETWQRMIDVSLSGVFYGMRAQIRHLLTVGGGAIVNTASVASYRPIADRAAYVAAKHGVLGLTEQGAYEYANDHIRVNAVAPGLTATSIFHSLPEHVQKSYGGAQPGGRPAQPEEIAAAIVWLLSDESSYVNGTCIKVENSSALR